MSEPPLPPDGFEVGHWSDPVGMTGCTVVLPPEGARGGIWVMGGGPGTRETDGMNTAERYIRVALVHDEKTTREGLSRLAAVL